MVYKSDIEYISISLDDIEGILGELTFNRHLDSGEVMAAMQNFYRMFFEIKSKLDEIEDMLPDNPDTEE